MQVLKRRQTQAVFTNILSRSVLGQVPSFEFKSSIYGTFHNLQVNAGSSASLSHPSVKMFHQNGSWQTVPQSLEIMKKDVKAC